MRMANCHYNFKHASMGRAASLAIASLLAIIATGDDVRAASVHKDRSIAFTDSPGQPMLAVVSLRDQQITVYDSQGWIARAPVSTGQKGRETPAGIFSVIEKEAEHYSNLYDDASMPHMQRITWSGIALHGGPLPGYAASHGCIRMPYDFATRLFDMTNLGMRVIVSPTDTVPTEISHPALFQPKPGAGAEAAARAAEAAEATRSAQQTKLAVMAASRESAKATVSARVAENLKAKADAQLALAERTLATATTDEAVEQARQTKATAATKAADADAQLANAKAELQAKLDALSSAREAAAAAETARATAAELARETARDLQPVSVFISRKTQRLYVRQGFQPILESPVTIEDVDRPIGTQVFTATDRANNDHLRWSVVSLDNEHRSEADRGNAKDALDRITIPQDVLDRITGVVGPRSSLIISDEAASSETGKGTDFIVLLSGEPQGGIKFRHHDPEAARLERPRGFPAYWSAPFASRYFAW
jgi:hypothetical protein